jgi:hypothetical protein
MTKRVRPETRCQEGTREHGTDRISNVSMGTLDGSILMGRVGSRRLDYVPALSKQVKSFLPATKFSSKVHPNVFGIDRGFGTLSGKPFGEPLNGRSLGAKSSSVNCVTKMVTQEYVLRFAMQATETTNALAVLGRLPDKAEVDRNTLIALSSLAGRKLDLLALCSLALRQIGQSSILVAIGKLGTPIAYLYMSLTRQHGENACARGADAK